MQPHASQFAERSFIAALLITGLVLVAEVIGGIYTGSLALLSDAAHVLMDLLALALSYVALRISARPADDRHTFGYHRMEVLAALANGLTLGVMALGILWEAGQRWLEPQPVKSGAMLVIAVIGLVANLVSAWLLQRSGFEHGHELAHADESTHEHAHSHDHTHDHSHPPEGAAPRKDLNLHSAYLHVLGDAISSVGVILAALLIGWTGAYWLDPLTGMLIGLVILSGAYRVTRAALHILIEGTPEGLSLDAVASALVAAPGLSEIHDLHVWSLCSGHIALSAHAVLTEQGQQNTGLVMADLQNRLRQQFGIDHTTIQFESPPEAREQIIQVQP